MTCALRDERESFLLSGVPRLLVAMRQLAADTWLSASSVLLDIASYQQMNEITSHISQCPGRAGSAVFSHTHLTGRSAFSGNRIDGRNWLVTKSLPIRPVQEGPRC
ncbi:hypothetical protein MLPF_3020 [Mycobacterium lepromatosis]|nr:hypothetical protein MLPF_3020 [Mycobacterium lepromatosis]